MEAVTDSKEQAFICAILPRKNFLSRPKVANVSNAVIVASLKNPDLDFEQLNRYIALCEFHKIKPILCFNKSDLINDNKLIEEIKQIYAPLGYPIFYTSTLLNTGTKELAKTLNGEVSILCGSSGVGKSSIINILSNGIFCLATKNVSAKTKRGVHTTRHCEIYNISENTSIVDTPGFQMLNLTFCCQKMFKNFFRNFPFLKAANLKTVCTSEKPDAVYLTILIKLPPRDMKVIQNFSMKQMSLNKKSFTKEIKRKHLPK